VSVCIYTHTHTHTYTHICTYVCLKDWNCIHNLELLYQI